MSYYWKYNHSKITSIYRIFGNGMDTIKEYFLNLPEDRLSFVFDSYGAEFGESAQKYAQKTYPKWKSGKVRLAGQTLERLISFVPVHMELDVKYDLIKQLVLKGIDSKDFREIEIARDEAQSDYYKACEEMRLVSEHSIGIPEDILKAANWLFHDDSTVIQNSIINLIKESNLRTYRIATQELGLAINGGLKSDFEATSFTINVADVNFNFKFISTRKSFWRRLWEGV